MGVARKRRRYLAKLERIKAKKRARERRRAGR